MPVITISLCMIVKNEEQTLPRCLQSAGDLPDEIIVVDTGSSDGTVAAARRFGATVAHFPWRDDFAAARNESFQLATRDYCLWLDADDVIEPADLERFRALKETLPPDTDVVMLPYHAAVDETGTPALTYERERLIRRAAGFRWEGAVHEVIVPAGVIRHGDAAVTHRKTGPGDPDRNLRILEGLRRRRPLNPREQFYYAREVMYHDRDAEAADALTAFLDDGRGWKEDCVQAALDLASCRERLGQTEQILPALSRALAYGPPRPELCCALGAYFIARKQWDAAAFWYEQALRQPPPETGFVVPDCRGYLPLLQLCVCSYHLGDTAAAAAFNEAAAQYRPDSALCRQNRAFFEQLHAGGGG